MQVKIEGLRELERALVELPKTTARNTLRRVLISASRDVEHDMEAGAPVDTGYTSRSVATSPTLNPRQRREIAREDRNDFAVIYIGSRRGSAAHLQEFGTVSQAAQPYMRPAWDSNKAKVLENIKRDLGDEIEKSAARLARKAARLG